MNLSSFGRRIIQLADAATFYSITNLFSTANTWTAVQTFSANPSVTGGAISFPATQVPSAGANDLDDYEEGTWTPTLTFATPGNLVVVYSLQNGTYTKVGRLVTATFQIVTTTFTWTTSAGNCTISGYPFTVNGTYRAYGPMRWRGVTKAGYTDISVQMQPATATAVLAASGSGVAFATIVAADMPMGGTVELLATVSYEV